MPSPGESISELPEGKPLRQDGPNGIDLDAFNEANGSTGMIVLHEGKVVYEGYWQGASRESLFSSWSMAKSFTSTLIGLAEADGAIASLEDPVAKYVPELADSAFRDVTIEQALQMSSGVAFEEGPDDIKMHCLSTKPGGGPVFADCDAVRSRYGDLKGFVLSLDRAAPPGARYNYSSADTEVLGWVLQNALGRSPAEYLSEKIWQPLGMEADAKWLLDGPDGTLVTSVGLNARLRDYARFGLLLMNDGVHRGERLIPEGWIERATTPSAPHLRDTGYLDYQYQWYHWAPGVFEAEGAIGQFLRIDQPHNLVVALTSAWPGRSGWDPAKALAVHAMLDSLVPALGYE
jgi:CubicO group peptidase (beta-lactamase class C family)